MVEANNGHLGLNLNEAMMYQFKRACYNKFPVGLLERHKNMQSPSPYVFLFLFFFSHSSAYPESATAMEIPLATQMTDNALHYLSLVN